MFSPDDIESNWLSQLKGKTLLHVGTDKEHRVPKINLEFRDGTRFTLSVIDGAWFEGCMVNTLRRAQPIVDVAVTGEGNDHIVELSASGFPLVVFIASTDKLKPGHPFPFVLTSQVGSNA